MMHWLLRALGVEDAHPEPVILRFPPTDAEYRYECVRQGAEQTIRRADRETEQTDRITQDLRFPLASVRMDDDA